MLCQLRAAKLRRRPPSVESFRQLFRFRSLARAHASTHKPLPEPSPLLFLPRQSRRLAVELREQASERASERARAREKSLRFELGRPKWALGMTIMTSGESGQKRRERDKQARRRQARLETRESPKQQPQKQQHNLISANQANHMLALQATSNKWQWRRRRAQEAPSEQEAPGQMVRGAELRVAPPELSGGGGGDHLDGPWTGRAPRASRISRARIMQTQIAVAARSSRISIGQPGSWPAALLPLLPLLLAATCCLAQEIPSSGQLAARRHQLESTADAHQAIGKFARHSAAPNLLPWSSAECGETKGAKAPN